MTLIGLIFMYTTSYTEFHKNLTTDVVPAARSHSDGRLDMVSTRDFCVILTGVVMNVVLLQDIPPSLTKISNKNMVESRNCEVRLTIIPPTFTSCEVLGGCGA